MHKTKLTLVSEFDHRKAEREISFEGPVITPLNGILAPEVIQGDRWEAHAEDSEKNLYIIIWEGKASPEEDHRKPDLILKYIRNQGRCCSVNRKEYSVQI